MGGCWSSLSAGGLLAGQLAQLLWAQEGPGVLQGLRPWRLGCLSVEMVAHLSICFVQLLSVSQRVSEFMRDVCVWEWSGTCRLQSLINMQLL